MPIAESLLPDFDHEMATTRALLELVPAERAAWKPHVKSMSLGDLAMHVARIPGWAQTVMTGTEFDTSPPDIPREAPPAFQSVGHLLKGFDEVVASARAKLAAATDGARPSRTSPTAAASSADRVLAFWLARPPDVPRVPS